MSINLKTLLPQIPIFATLEPEELEVARECLERKVLPENTVVFAEGDPGDGLYIVAMGAVKICKRIDDQNEKVIAAMAEKSFFGELALLDGKPRSASAVTTRPSVLLKISNEWFNAYMRKYPFAALKIVSQIACYLSIRLRDTNLRLAELENYRLLRG